MSAEMRKLLGANENNGETVDGMLAQVREKI